VIKSVIVALNFVISFVAVIAAHVMNVVIVVAAVKFIRISSINSKDIKKGYIFYLYL
jgi:hypothetical protein